MEFSDEYFDIAPDRRGSGSYKWDSQTDEDVIPLWVADMDFKTAPAVIDALRRRVDHGVFGYTLVDDEYYGALRQWFADRHGYTIDTRRVIYTSGVVPALSAIIKALAKPGDGVIVQTPVYNCFFSSIRNNGCRIVESPLLREDLSPEEFTYRMDFDDLERKAADPDSTILILCNPHNPAGRIWSREELERVADICRRHGVRVVSDEIHCELTMPGLEYTPYGTVDPAGVICLSPSKAFNIAGLQIANIVCPDDSVRRAVDRAININEVCDVNPLGVVALKAAYSPEGAAWLNALRGYLAGNYRLTRETIARELPGCPMALLEATYLPWIDVSKLGIPTEELEERLIREAGVWVNCGEMYGRCGFIRLNIACPRQRLAEGLRRLTGFLKKLC
ncbi:MAG: pyridoxal phosphate-dependent aminotransferase [Muribaculaceae bacterium]|nr:pyridoxal phosphate-dependent aminotransferase [Muribaculaceae bacterium]